MKYKKKLKKLDKTIRRKGRISCYLGEDPVYFNLIPLYRSDHFAAASFDVDFHQNGYLFFPVDSIRSFRKNGRLAARILKGEHIIENIAVPDVPLKSWKSIFRHFLLTREIISMDTATGYGYYAGYVTAVKKHSIRFRYFDGDGEWYPPVKLRFEEIHIVYYQDRYTELCAKYTEK